MLDALNSAQRAKHAAAAKDHRKGGHRAPHSDAQLRSAFTREDAAAGCADIDDQDEVDAGQQQDMLLVLLLNTHVEVTM